MTAIIAFVIFTNKLYIVNAPSIYLNIDTDKTLRNNRLPNLIFSFLLSSLYFGLFNIKVNISTNNVNI